MKKCLCLLLSLTMLCLCAGAALAETVALKVWGSQEDQELLAFFRQLGQLRRERLSLQEGGLTYLHARGGVLVLRRQLGDEITVAALNAGEDAAEVAIPWPRELAREALTFQQFYAPGGKLRLRLPPVSGMILI